jgi:hypothetical protein
VVRDILNQAEMAMLRSSASRIFTVGVAMIPVISNGSRYASTRNHFSFIRMRIGGTVRIAHGPPFSTLQLDQQDKRHRLEIGVFLP